MSSKLFDLTGRVALVTGSYRGLGLAMARGLTEAGAAVIINGRDEAAVAKAVEQLRADGLAAHGRAFDVTDEQAVAAAVKTVEADVGPIDILFNNAGINLRAAMVDQSRADWQKVLDTNLTAAFLVARAVAPSMIRRKRGKIVNTCSLMSEVGKAGIAAYTAAKGGLKMLTRAMAVEWGPHNIQVNGIGPGYFLTELTRPLADNPQFDQRIRTRTPAGRWGRPDELAGTAVFLASDASNFITGHVLYVDGGLLANL